MSLDNRKERAVVKAEDISLTPIIGSQKDAKRALYWKINQDSLSSRDDVKRASYILENIKNEEGISSSDWDFVMDQVKQWKIAELTKSDSEIKGRQLNWR